MDITKILKEATNHGASDIFIIAGKPLTYKQKDTISSLNDIKMIPKETYEFITTIYTLAQRDLHHFETSGDDTFSFTLPGISRFRVNAFKQQGTYAAVIRAIPLEMPHPSKLKIPETIMNLITLSSGMVLVTGPSSSGKSTTLACMINKANFEQDSHILTLEQPLEFVHTHQKSIISQREIFTDSQSYTSALCSAFYTHPDIILLDEIRDYEIMNECLKAVETGSLLFSSFYTTGLINTIERIVHMFPSEQQEHICTRLATSLQAVVSQKLLPTITSEIVPVFELVVLTPDIRDCIRSRNLSQIEHSIASLPTEYRISMDDSIEVLYKEGIIRKDVAIHNATNPIIMAKHLNLDV